MRSINFHSSIQHITPFLLMPALGEVQLVSMIQMDVAMA